MTKERSGSRSAACITCGKTFARSDTLLRHEKSHHATEDRGPVHRVTNGTFRACSACASARSRCSGEIPSCGRCNIRKINCVYPNKRRKAGHEGQVLKFVDSPTQPAAKELQDVPISTNSHLQSAPAHPISLPTSPNPDTTSTPGQTPDPFHVFGDQSVYRDGVRSEPTDPPLTVTVPAPTIFSRVQPLPNQIDSNHQRHPDVSLSGHFQPDFNVAPYNYSSFDEPINWIPVSQYPSPFDNEFEHDLSFLFPPLLDSAAVNLDYSNSIPYEVAGQLYKKDEPVPQLDARGLSETYSFPGSLIGHVRSPASSINNEHLTTKSIPSSAEISERRKRRKPSYAPDNFTKPQSEKEGFGFPDVPLSEPANAESLSPHPYCSTANHDAILDAFQRLCIETKSPRPFRTLSFPGLDVLNACIDLYFENFHGTFPLIHRSTFINNANWIILLATAAIGSTFLKIAYAAELQDAFQEFLRRATCLYTEGVAEFALDLPLAHARILNLISLAQSGREQLRSAAPRYQADLSRWCLESGVLQLPDRGDSQNSGSVHTGGIEREWGHWIRVESLRRAGYLCWLLDTSLAYLANCRPHCNMDDARTPLPCSEVLWKAQDAVEWKSEYAETETPPSLCAALEYLYAKKAIDPRLSDISQILLINALFQRTWEVGTHIKQPLSEWVPTGKARGFLNTPTKDSFWLPLYPLYANWRNSACDCLDVIHWQAASTVAKASGVEHDLMLHLHLARIILLTPFQEIQDLLFSLIGRVGHASRASFYVHDGSYQPRNLAKLPQIRKITWRWLREDQHKARLAIVHAGSVFWHVRRYSSVSLYEPLAVYLASMVLWTYGSYKSAALERDAAANSNSKPVGGPSGPDSDLSTVQPSRVERKLSHSQLAPTSAYHDPQSTADPIIPPSHPSHASQASAAIPSPASLSEPSSDSDSEDQMPQFIHLDRPCDDEMIQHFVRNGHNMSGYMANVGDICKTPNKVLVEGAKLLRTRLGCWGISREYYDVLSRLEEVAEKKGN